MKLNLPSKTPRTATSQSSFAPQPVLTPRASLYQSVEEAARRKHALITRINERQRAAKAALVARRTILKSTIAPPT